jgi:hypothetical protein
MEKKRMKETMDIQIHYSGIVAIEEKKEMKTKILYFFFSLMKKKKRNDFNFDDSFENQ